MRGGRLFDRLIPLITSYTMPLHAESLSVLAGHGPKPL